MNKTLNKIRSICSSAWWCFVDWKNNDQEFGYKRRRFYRMHAVSPRALTVFPVDSRGRPVANDVPFKTLSDDRLEFLMVENGFVAGVRGFHCPPMLDLSGAGINPEKPPASIQINFDRVRHLDPSDVLTVSFGAIKLAEKDGMITANWQKAIKPLREIVNLLDPGKSCMNCKHYLPEAEHCENMETPLGYVGKPKIFYCNFWGRGSCEQG